jgi:hypothetical protein
LVTKKDPVARALFLARLFVLLATALLAGLALLALLLAGLLARLRLVLVLLALIVLARLIARLIVLVRHTASSMEWVVPAFRQPGPAGIVPVKPACSQGFIVQFPTLAQSGGVPCFAAATLPGVTFDPRGTGF